MRFAAHGFTKKKIWHKFYEFADNVAVPGFTLNYLRAVAFLRFSVSPFVAAQFSAVFLI